MFHKIGTLKNVVFRYFFMVIGLNKIHMAFSPIFYLY